jgi:hypothetical protein
MKSPVSALAISFSVGGIFLAIVFVGSWLLNNGDQGGSQVPTQLQESHSQFGEASENREHSVELLDKTKTEEAPHRLITTRHEGIVAAERSHEVDRQADARSANAVEVFTSPSTIAVPIAASSGVPVPAMQGLTPDGRRIRTLDPAKGPLDVRPREDRARKSRKSFNGDLRSLASKPKRERVRFVHEKVLPAPRTYGLKAEQSSKLETDTPQASIAPEVTNPAPAPINTFEAMGRTGGWGNGYPPDPSGDVGPNHYVQAINTALAVYDKRGVLLAGPMNLDTFMSQGSFGNICDSENYGDPVVLYDTFEDRWIVSDFAFASSGSAVANPPGAFQCIAVSKTGDPVAGGWNFYFINRTDALNDYPKLGIWPDGIYMSANMFDMSAGGFYHGVTVWALNKAQMYAGAPSVQIVSFDIGTGDFALLPSNARLQTGTPSPGTPNYFVSTWNFVNALSVYKFYVDWDRISLSTFTGPEIPLAPSAWPDASLSNASVPGGGSTLDPVEIRPMMQNNYSRVGGVESLWLPHTVRRVNATGSAAPRWYQINVTGGSVAPNLPQAATWDPDGNNIVHRYLPSLAVDRAGNMALGYTASSSSMHPSIKYAGRLASDPANTFSRTEQTMFAAGGSQAGSSRWGDYTHMTLDPDGCTFWYTNQYYSDTGSIYRTRVGSFKFDECGAVGKGSLSGTVTSAGLPLAGATVSLGSRKVTTDASGSYVFNDLPAGTYPAQNAAKPGFTTAYIASVIINEASTSVQNFVLDAASADACLPDTSQTQFENGIPENVDLTSSGDIVLGSPLALDQGNIDLIVGSGTSFTTAWHGQTFTSAVTGPVKRVDLHLFSADCSSTTMPQITVSLRAASGNLPTGPNLATVTMPGFCDGTSKFRTVIFASPPTLIAGTQYAIVWRSSLTNPSVDPNPRYVSTVSESNPYSGGRRSSSTDNGATWTAAGNANNDFGFRVYVDKGFSPTGTYVSNLKDANPATGALASWGSLTWNNAPLPSGTSIKFQAAGSDSPSGPFDFVGADGTNSSYFTNGSPLSQFNGKRYLRYKAILATSNGANTPTLSDVNVCFSNQAVQSCANASMPTQASKSGVALSVPVTVSDISGLKIRSADFKVDFIGGVVQPAGNASNNWGVTLGSVGASNGGGRTLTVTSPSPGTLVLSVFGVADMEGSGSLVDLNFNVIGQPASSTSLSFGSFVFNEGHPCTNTSNGFINVVSGSVSGKVTFGNEGTAPFTKAVPNVSITASGSVPRADNTKNDGTYSVSAMGTGQYTLTPNKTGDVQTAVSGFDAAAIATHAVGGTQLLNNQLAVADVSGNGTVTSFDAALVASFAANLPEAGSAGTWRFMPASRNYPDVVSDHISQDFVALLMGDVTGNWAMPAPPAPAGAAEDIPLQISIPSAAAASGTTVALPITIGDTTGLGIRAYEFDLHYNADVLEPTENAASVWATISDGRVLTVNATQKGMLRIVTFGAYPLQGTGELLRLNFKVIGAAGAVSELRWANFRLNEGGINFNAENGGVSVAPAQSGSINGRLLDPRGIGVSQTRVMLTDTQGNQRSVMTSTLGYFQVSELQIGETYTIRAQSRRYRFSTQSISITSDNAVEFQLIGLE